MDDYKYSQIKMMRTCADFLAANPTVTATMPKFGIYYSVVTGNLLKIDKLIPKLDESSSGQTSEKKFSKDQMINSTFDIALKLAAFANNTQNYTLLKEVRFTKSSFKIGEEKLVGRCQNVHDRGVQYLTDTAAYNLTADELEAQQELIDQFTGKLSSVRLVIGARSNTEDQTLLFINEGMTALKSIDLLVNMKHSTNPDFFHQYYSARRVIGLPQSSHAAIGSVTDGEEDLPVKGVSINVYAYKGAEKTTAGKNEKSILTRTSGAKGRFNIPTLEPGTYLVVASKPGFRDNTAVISISKGETTHIELVMEKGV